MPRRTDHPLFSRPNCNDLLPANGCCPECGPKDVYFELYKETALGIKAADARVQVGGPATAMLSWVPEFTTWCRANGAPLDFVSSHLYPTDPQLPLGRDNFMEAVANASAQAAAAGVPFMLTEFNAGLGSPEDNSGFSMLDSSFAAAFLLHQHLLAQAVPNLASMSYWTFSDWGFEEEGVDPTPWRPGTTKFGILNDEGVAKPAYRGLEFIAQAAGDGVLPVTPAAGAGAGARAYAGAAPGTSVGATAGAVDVSVTVADGVITALLGSFNATGGVLPQPTAVTLTFRNLPAPLPAGATIERVDEGHANAMATWTAAGSPLYSPPAVIFAELAASQVAVEALAVAPAGAGAVSVTFTLDTFAVARVRLTLGGV